MRIISQDETIIMPFDDVVLETQVMNDGSWRVWANEKVMGDYGSRQEAVYVMEKACDAQRNDLFLFQFPPAEEPA